MKELIVPSGQVNELFGVKTPEAPVGLLPKDMFGINLRRLTVTDPTNPAFGEWVDRHAVLKWLQACNQGVGGDAKLEKMIDQYREVMGL